MPVANVTIDGSVGVGPAERKLPPAMAPLGISANGWSEFRIVPPTIVAFTEPVRVQGVVDVQSAGEDRSRKEPAPPPKVPVTFACAPSEAARAAEVTRVFKRNFMGIEPWKEGLSGADWRYRSYTDEPSNGLPRVRGGQRRDW